MTDQTDDKTTDPRRPAGMPLGHLSPGQLVHFIAARELADKGMLAADTVELLVFFSPRPVTSINPICDKPGHTLVTSSIVGAGKAFNGGWHVNTDDDVKSMGAKSEAMIEQGTNTIAQVAKAHLKQVMAQQVMPTRKKLMDGVAAIKNGTAVKTTSGGKPTKDVN